jgi:hypothetical protein
MCVRDYEVKGSSSIILLLMTPHRNVLVSLIVMAVTCLLCRNVGFCRSVLMKWNRYVTNSLFS